MTKTYNINIISERSLPSPRQLKAELPITTRQEEFVRRSRREIEGILDGYDCRKIALVGPCSIHNVEEAIEYAVKLQEIAKEVRDKIFVVMRAYFEKPRTGLGWKGLVRDPDLKGNGSYDIPKGMRLARSLLIKLANMEIPAATEALDPLTVPYTSDLLSYASIGARTVVSQTHREMASGLSMPVGLKNSTEGGIEAAVNAIICARNEEEFLGINQDGRIEILHTSGNPYAHLILRGYDKSTNYDSESVANAVKVLRDKKLNSSIIIDCSHGNSRKDYRKQPEVLQNILEQITSGQEYAQNIKGFMLESYLAEGNQAFVPGNVRRGLSITDSCISIERTYEMLREAYDRLKEK